MVRTLTYYQVDTFTNRPFSGYPVAVITQSMGLSDEEMFNIAQELNVLGTAFVLPSIELARSHNRIRHFTKSGELLGSHATTIASLCVLATERKIPVPFDGSLFYRIENNLEDTFPVEIRCHQGKFDKVFLAGDIPTLTDVASETVSWFMKSMDLRDEDIDDSLRPFYAPDLRLVYLPLTQEKRLQSLIFPHEQPFRIQDDNKTLCVPFTVQRREESPRVIERFPLQSVDGMPPITAADATTALAMHLVNAGICETSEVGVSTLSIQHGINPDRAGRFHFEVKELDGALAAIRIGGAATVVMTGKILLT